MGTWDNGRQALSLKMVDVQGKPKPMMGLQKQGCARQMNVEMVEEFVLGNVKNPMCWTTPQERLVHRE